MSDKNNDKASDYKTGGVEKAAKQIKEVQKTKQTRLDEIMKEMQSSTVNGN